MVREDGTGWQWPQGAQGTHTSSGRLGGPREEPGPAFSCYMLGLALGRKGGVSTARGWWQLDVSCLVWPSPRSSTRPLRTHGVGPGEQRGFRGLSAPSPSGLCGRRALLAGGWPCLCPPSPGQALGGPSLNPGAVVPFSNMLALPCRHQPASSVWHGLLPVRGRSVGRHMWPYWASGDAPQGRPLGGHWGDCV